MYAPSDCERHSSQLNRRSDETLSVGDSRGLSLRLIVAERRGNAVRNATRVKVVVASSRASSFRVKYELECCRFR
jgi:hypothetical protein